MPTYLLRVNLDITERDFRDHIRFRLAASSIKYLAKKNNKVVILSHLGRPQARTNAERSADLRGKDRRQLASSQRQSAFSLRKFAPALSAATGKKVKFVSHFNFPKIKKLIEKSPQGSVFLLENIRFLPGETKNSKLLAKQLASLGNRYINDDFAASHRPHASLVAITKFLPSQAGQILKTEIKNLKKARDHYHHPFILVIGGGKMGNKVTVIRYLLPKVNNVLIGGGPANNFLKIKKVDIGSSIFDPKLIQTTKLLLRSGKVVIPSDWRKERGKILDIGPETIRLYSGFITKARTIIWNGPMGYFEEDKFARGTEGIAKAILKNKKAQIVIGGVETVASLPFKVNKQEYGNVFVSTGGGAMLEFLAGKKLPAIAALNQKTRTFQHS